MRCFRRWATIDIAPLLAALPSVTFDNTGGTNGWIATPPWLAGFIETLDLGGHVVDAVLRKLPAGQGIPPHVDPRVGDARRFHIPIVTHPAVTMRWPEDEETVHLQAGGLYEVRVELLHEIVQHAPIDRIHLVVTILQPDLPALEDLEAVA